MSADTRWSGAERGTPGALRLATWLYTHLGRRFAQGLLYPIAAYFFVRERSRDASRRYLARVWAHPEGRRHLPGPPGFFAPLRHYHEFAIQILDRIILWARGIGELRMDSQGGEHLFALERERRGALLLGAHLGSYDMPRQLAGAHGLVLNVVMFTADAEQINRFFGQLDPKSQVRVLSLEPGSMRTAFEIRACIERGELVAILADRVPDEGKDVPARIEFLGGEIPISLSPFRLACLLGCPVLSSLCLRKGDAHYETVVRPIELPAGVADGTRTRLPRQEREKAALEMARAWVKHLEDACVRHPYQWFNFYDVWAEG